VRSSPASCSGAQLSLHEQARSCLGPFGTRISVAGTCHESIKRMVFSPPPSSLNGTYMEAPGLGPSTGEFERVSPALMVRQTSTSASKAAPRNQT